MRLLVVDEGSEGQRLDNFLIRELKGAPKTLVYRIIRSGEVRVNKGRAAADTRLTLGDQVRVPPLRLAASADAPEGAGARPAPAREFPLLYEDDHLLAVAKPAGVAVHGGSGVAFGVIEQLRQARPQAKFLELVHRLDKETSGILLVAKKRSALTALQEQFRQRRTDKQYSALVVGDWPAGLGRIEVALVKTLDAQGERRVRVATGSSNSSAVAAGRGGTRRDGDDEDDGLPSLTLVRPRERLPATTLLDVTIKTGRTHQIRVHLQHAGHPIVGDDKYGDFELNHAWSRQGVARPDAATAPRLRFERMFLHARRLAFDHPASGARLTLEAALPTDCLALLRHLGATPATLEALARSQASAAPSPATGLPSAAQAKAQPGAAQTAPKARPPRSSTKPRP